MYYDGEDALVLIYIFIMIVFIVGLVTLAVHASNADEKHEIEMRNQYAQCVKDNKEWVLTDKYGIDGICVTKR